MVPILYETQIVFFCTIFADVQAGSRWPDPPFECNFVFFLGFLVRSKATDCSSDQQHGARRVCPVVLVTKQRLHHAGQETGNSSLPRTVPWIARVEY